jgi:hypothetical protein
MLHTDNFNFTIATGVIIAGSPKLNIPDTGEQKLRFVERPGGISRLSFKCPLRFFALLHPVQNKPTTKLAIDSQAPANGKSRRKIT